MSYGRYSSKSYGSSYLSDSSSRLSGYRSQIASPLSCFESASASSGVSSYRINSPSPLGGVSSNLYLSSTVDKGYMGRSSKQSDLGNSFGSKYGSSLSYGTSRTLDYKTSSGLESRTSGFSSSYLSKSGRETPSYRSSTLTSPSTDLNYYSSSNTSSYSTGSHSTYRTPSREYGTNYSLRSSPSSTSPAFSGLGSTSGQQHYTKSSAFSLTPFETRRNTHATDYHHVSSISSTRSPPAALATTQPTRATLSTKKEESPVKEKPVVDDSKIKKKISERRLSESSDSFDESSDVRDHNMRYLTNRATSPFEVDELNCSNSLFDRNKYKTRNRLMARKKTKAYPISDRTRRRQLKNANTQVDVIDLDVSSGRITPTQAAAALASLKKPIKQLTQDKLPSKNLEPKETIAAPTSAAPTSAAPTSAAPTSAASTCAATDTTTLSVNKITTNQIANESSSPKNSAKKQVTSPKQSGFVPKNRKVFVASQQDDANTQTNDKPLWRKNLIEKQQLQQADQLPDVTPKQSSFAGKQWKNKFVHSSQAAVEDNNKLTTGKPQLGSSLTLKESLEKVRKWKKQFAETQTRIKNDEEAETEESIFGKDEWKKKKVLQKNSNLPDGVGLSSSSSIKTSNEPYFNDDHNISKNSNTTKPASRNSQQTNKKHTTNNNIDCNNNYNTSNNMTSLPDLSKVGDVDKHKKSTLGTTLSMLPDLISSSEEKLKQMKQGGFISKMKDIDSLLGYDEDEEENLNEDEKSPSQRNRNTGDNNNNNNNDNTTTNNNNNKLTPFEQALSDFKIFGCDIDADLLFPQPFLPVDFVTSVLASNKRSINNDSSKDDLKSRVEKFEISSCESILDSPVPATPDLPLFPVQAFEYPSNQAPRNGKKSSSENKLNTNPHLEDLETELGLKNLKNKSDNSESETDEESSSSSKQGNSADTSDNNQTKVTGNGLMPRVRREEEKDSSVTSFRLIDIDSDEDGQKEKSRTQNRIYSKNYSDVAISRALTYHRNSGHVSMEAILKICRLSTESRNDKKDENRKFGVFEEVDEALESLSVDVKRLEDCCIALHERGINEIYLKVIVPNIGNRSDEVHSQLVRHKLALRAKVAALLEKIKISTIPMLEVIFYSLKDLFKKSEEFLRTFIDLRGINQILELVVTFSSRTHSNSHRGHCLDHLCIRVMTQILFSPLGMRILARDDKFIKWLMTFVFVKHPKELTSASLLMMSLMMRCSDVSASIIFKLMMIHSKKNEKNLWCQLMELLKTDSASQEDGNNVKDLDCNCLHFINSLLKMLPDADSSLDFSDHLEELDFEKYVHLRSYTTQKKSLQDLFASYEKILKEIDALEVNDAANSSTVATIGLVRKKPPRNPHRKSKRYSKWKEIPVNEDRVAEKRATNKLETTPDEPKSHVSKRSVTLHFQEQFEEQTNETKTSKPDDDVCFSGLLEKAKVGLMSKKSNGRSKVQSIASEKGVEPKIPDKPDHEQQWEQALEKPVGTLKVKEMDFTDLTEVDELNYLDSQPIGNAPPGFKGGLSSLKPLMSKTGRHQEQQSHACPPPPPLAFPPFSSFPIPPPPTFPAPPPPPGLPRLMGLPLPPLGLQQPPSLVLPPPPPPGLPPPPRLPPFTGAGLMFSSSGDRSYSSQQNPQSDNSKRTIKLHWKEARAEFYTPSGRTMETIWGRVAREVGAVKIEKKKFEELFVTKTLDVKVKKIELSKKVTVLDSKRSNAINIALTSLPPVATIKTAILNMDGSVLSKEGIEKILNSMLPTEEEVARITDVQIKCSDEAILGSAEQFLVSISTISEVKSRLRLWLFMVEFDTIEADITSNVSDLKLSMKQLKSSQTLKYALITLLAIGNCLNNVKTQGFTMDYLEKVSEVKDVTRKHSLLYHLVSMVIDHYGNEVTDLFSDLEAVHRCAKISWDDISEKLIKLEEMCKSSWEDLRKVSMHESNPATRKKLSETLSDLAERIILLKLVHNRLNRRFGHLLLYFGYPAKSISEVKINFLLKIISDFSVEFKQTREKILKYKQKKEAKEMKILQQHRIKMVQHLTSKSEYKIESQDETDDGVMVSSWFDPDFKTTKSTSLGQLGNSYVYTSEAETGDEELIEAACRSALRPSRNKKRYNCNSDKLHSSWKESLANRDRSVY